MMKALLLALACVIGCAIGGGAIAAGVPDPDIDFGALPLELAVTQVHGNGLRVFATFEDPNCRYCKRMAGEFAEMNDVTIHTFLYPILTADSGDKARAVWCAPDRAKAWNDWMQKGIAPRRAKCDTDAIERLLALGRKLHVRAVPTIVLADGERIVGAIAKVDLELMISAPKAMAALAEVLKKTAPRPAP